MNILTRKLLSATLFEAQFYLYLDMKPTIIFTLTLTSSVVTALGLLYRKLIFLQFASLNFVNRAINKSVCMDKLAR